MKKGKSSPVLLRELASEDITKCCREKYWSECTADEKADRLRQEIFKLRKEVNSLLSSSESLLFNHQHGSSGETLFHTMRMIVGLDGIPSSLEDKK
jgi:hypothetical protein